jgi:hypothetical protein
MDHEPVVSTHGSVDDVDERSAHPFELAQSGSDLVDELRTVSSHPAPAGRGVGPPGRYLGIALGQDGNVHEPGGDAWFSHVPMGHGLGQKGLPGVITELGAHDVDHAG